VLAGTGHIVEALYVISTGPAMLPAPTTGSEEIVQHDDAVVLPAIDADQSFRISTWAVVVAGRA
jgi:hypothetical protein